MIKNGIEVIVDGLKATVVRSFASGKHRQYTLSDGRTVLDLHIAVENNTAKVLPNIIETKVKPVAKQEQFRRLPRDDEDIVD